MGQTYHFYRFNRRWRSRSCCGRSGSKLKQIMSRWWRHCRRHLHPDARRSRSRQDRGAVSTQTPGSDPGTQRAELHSCYAASNCTAYDECNKAITTDGENSFWFWKMFFFLDILYHPKRDVLKLDQSFYTHVIQKYVDRINSSLWKSGREKIYEHAIGVCGYFCRVPNFVKRNYHFT